MYLLCLQHLYVFFLKLVCFYLLHFYFADIHVSCCRHLIGFLLFLALTIYTAMKLPQVVDLPTLQHLPDVLRNADLHKLHQELLTCLPSLPHMPDLHRYREELKASFPSMDSLSNWHIVELLTNCLPERFSHNNHTDICVLVLLHFVNIAYSKIFSCVYKMFELLVVLNL